MEATRQARRVTRLEAGAELVLLLNPSGLSISYTRIIANSGHLITATLWSLDFFEFF